MKDKNELIYCNACGAPINDELLAKLKLTNKVECEYCGNLIVLNDDASFKEQFKCSICGAPISAKVYNKNQLVCQYCFEDIEAIEFQEAEYRGVWKRIQEIPDYKLEEVSQILMEAVDSEEYKQLPANKKKIVQKYGLKLVEETKAVKNSINWKIAKKSIKVIAKGVGILLGIAVGGILGSAIGLVLSTVGSTLIEKIH
jgi:DNA-directed RNA polymerase subunit RPC12/RpoP